MNKIIFALLMGFLLFGCIGGLGGVPTEISQFAFTKGQDGTYLLIFTVKDDSGKTMNVDGNLKIEIYDEKKTLYNGTVPISKSDFGSDGKVQIKIEKSKVGKTKFYNANAKLTLTTGNSTLTKTAEVFVDAYTNEEAAALAEPDYQANAKTIDYSLTVGDFDIKIVKAGVYDSDYLRLDLEMTNKDPDKGLESWLTEVKGDGVSLQFHKKGADLKYQYFQPGQTQKGYLVYELKNGTPKTLDLAFSAQKYQNIGEGSDISEYGKTFDLTANIKLDLDAGGVSTDYKSESQLEQEYQASAKTVNKNVKIGDFSIHITKVGKHGDYLRIDLTMTNTDSSRTLSSKIKKVTADGKELEYNDHHGEISVSGFCVPGKTKTGFVTYEYQSSSLPKKIEIEMTGEIFYGSTSEGPISKVGNTEILTETFEFDVPS